MPSSRRLLLSVEADGDLTDIWQFTAERWGDAQADHYFDRVRERLLDLTRFPHLGRARDEVTPGLRSLVVERHVAFYTVQADRILVRRILHPSRDLDDLLADR